jgi:uncharacterized protein
MQDLFEVKQIDREFYQSRLQSFLPAKMIDIHTHVWLDSHRNKAAKFVKRSVEWPSRVAKDNSAEDLVKTYKLMFPGKQVMPLIFGNPGPGEDFDIGNNYIRECAEKHHFPALIFARPEWSSGEFEERMIAGGFIGCKVYLNFAPEYIPEKEIRIFDYLPHHQLEVLNRYGWITMLHIPRDGRLKDPVNLAQMLEIEQKYPDIRLIIAHVGRAYCCEDVGDAFATLSKTRRMMFDISANTNAEVFRQLIEAVGPRRILFGSDLPILRMRMKRIDEGGNYVNVVPKDLYGDVSGDRHMREVEGEEAGRLTFFMYEEIDAFRRAAEETGLTASDIEDVFYGNASKLIGSRKG